MDSVPHGWKAIKFDDFTTLQRGKDLTKSQFKSGNIPVAGSNGVIGYHDESFVKAPGVTVGRSGSCGKVNFYDVDFWAHNTSLYVRNFHGNDERFASYLLEFLDLGRFRTGASVPTLDRNSFKELPIIVPEVDEQRRIAYVLTIVQTAIEQQERLIALTRELKSALIRKLFTEGLRQEKQKETEIGLVPESWDIKRLKEHCDVVTSSWSYTHLIELEESDDDDAVEVFGIKVSDMNLAGNETRIFTSNLAKRVTPLLAKKKAVPAGTIVFPKRGAAIATNKKRLTTTWTVFDPNLIGVKPRQSLDTEFIYHWFQRFDLRRITDPGPTPQLNKKDLEPLQIPIPKDFAEQTEIAKILRTVEKKIELHSDKQSHLEELFRTLLHQLMTGQVRVNNLDIDSPSPEGEKGWVGVRE